MEVLSIGYNHSHNTDFVIDRPQGTGEWLLLLIKSPAIFRQGGKNTAVNENSFILYAPNEPQYYRANKTTYTDDWVHLSLNYEDVEMLNALEIPLNTVTKIGTIAELTGILRNTTCEFHLNNYYKTDIVELYLKMFFLKLGQTLRSKKYSGTSSSSVYFDRMQNLRSDIFNEPQKKWSIDQMANELSMSRSTFQHTYKKIFGVCPINDILESRLSRAQFLLATTEFTIREIAELCGFNSESYFIRQFKNKYNTTPTQFRSCR